ncbi:apolipoprotein N-acyltransferase [Prosthecobacter debontii]|uniref:Apolipoprotein N-acyltransferase n=1 Tax=Prosthecobacter debontii TaxID=48467 RepID=A0A1T4Y9G1_9BACT|nr:apolipoprotein N-acyltransferase [Prosthecobacter debontii]SKA97915.1 apolipoprotein N-acyltransferase [Prosthecobacter debontii]
MTAFRPFLRYLLPLLGGAILSFAYPGWNLEIAVWLWLLPLLAVIWPMNGEPQVKRPFLMGWLAGLAFWIPNLSWLRHSSRVIAGARDDTWVGFDNELMGAGAVLGLALYCALYFGLWAWIVSRFIRPSPDRLATGRWQSSTWHSLSRSLAAAAVWTALEWVRGWLFTGFGWNGLGVALHRNAVLIQIADVVGVTGLSFLPTFIACTAWNTLTRVVWGYRGEGTCRSRLDFTLAMIVLLGVAGYGMLKLTASQGEMIKVRTVLVQPNVAQVDAWSGDLGPEVYHKLADFTRLYAEARDGVTHVDLVIWPESALPVHLYGLRDHEPYFNELLSLGDYSLLTGTEIHEPERRGHVSAVLFKGGYDQRQLYHKVHLVPFGEYLPFRNIPPFSFLQGVLPGDFAPGGKTEPLLLAKPEVQIIPLICFEDTVGDLARKFTRPVPQMIVNITNDGWFLESIETEVHLANAKFRAVELRRPMVRAANTGISCFIDVFGHVESRLADPETNNTFIEGCLPGEVKIPQQARITFYAKYGDAFSMLTLLVTLGIIGQGQWQKRRRPSAA